METVETTAEVLSFKILERNLSQDFINSDLSIKTSNLVNYFDELKRIHQSTLVSRSDIVGELFLLHETAKSLFKYNEEVLKFSSQKFRSKILFPVLLNSLIRILPLAKKFLIGMVKTVYYEIKKSSESIIISHTNTFYLDEDVIRQDVLLEFLGNGLRKFNPLELENYGAFYRVAFRKVFSFYFKKEQRIHSSYTDLSSIDSLGSHIYQTPTRVSIYRDVLYNLQIEEFLSQSPTLTQISYNFSVFQNVVINNELQDMYFAVNSNSFAFNNNRYKLFKLYNDEIIDKLILNKINKLPIIYRLLKCVHINNKSKPINETYIKSEAVRRAVYEELMFPFRNLFSEGYIGTIIENISNNFVNSFLTGEYINLLSLDTVKITQISFIQQVRRFIKICLDESFKRE